MSRRFTLYLFFVISLCLLRPLADESKGPYLFLIWNLFLGGLPLFFASFQKRLRNRPLLGYFNLAAWLVFFPNAPYILTDLVHLNHSQGFDWYDTALIFAAGVAGLKFTFDSLAMINSELKLKFPSIAQPIWNCAFLALAAYGIYLGRYLRFNSWDVLHAPEALFKACGSMLLYPQYHLQEWLMVGTYSMLLIALQLIWPKEQQVLEKSI